jgi:hypothetical protein
MNKIKILLPLAVIGALCVPAAASFNDSQGFETNTGDWVASAAITRVPSGGGVLGVPSRSGAFHAEIGNLPDGYGYPGYGDAGYSLYGGEDAVYHGDFYQSIDVYVYANWVPAAATYDPAFWIDMTPYHSDPDNYGAEHNFRLKATGSSVEVRVDGQAAPIATLSTSGWYTFEMTYRRASNLADPVLTDMNVYDTAHALHGTTTVTATAPGGPFASADLRGNGYVWLTLWQNGFANDVLAIDNARTGLLPFPGSATPRGTKADVSASLAVLLPTGDKSDDQRIRDALGHISKSLDPTLWIDALRLASDGHKVFDEESAAVQKLDDVVKHGRSVATPVQSAILALVEADRDLAQQAINDAAGGKASELSKAADEMQKAANELAKGHESQAIDRYREAWKHAKKA